MIRKGLRLGLILAAALLWLLPARALTLPAGLTAIGEEAFCGTAMTDVTVPEGVRSIGSRAFAGSALTHAVLPDTLIYIAPNAFDGVSSDFWVTAPEGSYAQRWCAAHNVLCTSSDILYETPAVTALSFSRQGAKYIGWPYIVMDCQAFVERCLLDAGLDRNLAGSNAWYREMDWTGTPEECTALFGAVPKGAFLFILEHNGKEPDKYKPDGLGNASHIGICTGTGLGAIHSSYTRGGVYESVFTGRTINGGWNRVGLWRELDYGDEINRWLATH